MVERRIGISGWTYARWRGVFYPKGLTQKRELEYASERLNTVEINGTFYSLQRPTSYQRWHANTPDDFLFAVKGPQYITHRKSLKDIRQPLANFFASGVLCLGNKLGPILWQFPQWLKYNPERFETFLEILPRTSSEALALAAEHNLTRTERVWLEPVADTEITYAFEVRNESFMTPEFIDLLRRHNAALCFADTAQRWPYTEDVTSTSVYIRLHGAEDLYSSGYTEEQLQWWANRIRRWAAGEQPDDARLITTETYRPDVPRSVYVYFDNDAKVHAPFDAIRLAEILRGEEEEASRVSRVAG